MQGMQSFQTKKGYFLQNWSITLHSFIFGLFKTIISTFTIYGVWIQTHNLLSLSLIIFRFFKYQYNLSTNTIWHWDSNSQPFGPGSLPFTIRPENAFSLNSLQKSVWNKVIITTDKQTCFQTQTASAEASTVRSRLRKHSSPSASDRDGRAVDPSQRGPDLSDAEVARGQRRTVPRVPVDSGLRGRQLLRQRGRAQSDN